MRWIIKPHSRLKMRFLQLSNLSLRINIMQRENVQLFVSKVLTSVQILVSLAKRVMDGIIGIADFTMYFSAVTVLTVTLSSVVSLIGDYNRRQLAVYDFDELSAGALESGTKTEKDLNGLDIVFEDVWFAYPNTDKFVLKNINIRIAEGEKLSVVGQNGAGKTTFIKLICRFYRPTRGRITLGGVDIHDIDKKDYSRLISAVFQDFCNFPFSVRENITMGNTGSVSVFTLGKWIDRLPLGLETYVTRNFSLEGVELSGGEGQKLALLRAMNKNTPILILDEPTASLDPLTESEIYDEYFNIAKNKTTIFISHRLASSTIADHIVLFEDGQIIGYGSHEQLMKDCDTYARMFELQRQGYVRS